MMFAVVGGKDGRALGAGELEPEAAPEAEFVARGEEAKHLL